MYLFNIFYVIITSIASSYLYEENMTGSKDENKLFL